MKKYETEVHLRCYDNDVDRYLTVMPSPENPEDNVVLMADLKEREHWGDVYLDIPAGLAIELGRALIVTAQRSAAKGTISKLRNGR